MARTSAAALVAALLIAPIVSPAAGQPAAGPPVAVAYAERAAPGEAVWRRWDGEAWSGPGTVWAGAGTVAWQELRVCSDWTRMARVSLEWSGAARVQLWDGSAWGAAAELTGDAGTRSSKVVAAAFEHTSGDLLVVYRERESTALRFRTHAGVLSAEASVPGLTLDGPARWITLASKPGGDEVVMLAASAARLYAAVWDGTEWGSPVTLETSLPGSGRAFDVVYMSQSGRALAVWAPSSGAPRARIWTGLAWAPAVTLPSPGGDVRWLALAANPKGSSDEVLVATLDAARDVNLGRWSGLAWDMFTEVETNAAAADEPRVGVAFQPDGESALAVWHADGHTALRSRVWNGVAWSSTRIGPEIGMPTCGVALSPGRGDDEVVLAARGAVRSIEDYLLYTTEGDLDADSATVGGPVGEGVPGVTLPTPPAPGGGGVDLDYGNNDSISIAPGTYGALRFGNSCTASLGPGTYRFESLDAGNNLTLSFDTAAGDVDFILTSGDFHSNNNEVIVNGGDGRVTIHVLSGDFRLKNNAEVRGRDVIAYHGDITLGNNAEVSGRLHASGDVEIGSGVVEAPPWFGEGIGRLCAVVWRGGVPGARLDLSGAPSGAPAGGVAALTDRPRAARRVITGWTEIDPTR